MIPNRLLRLAASPLRNFLTIGAVLWLGALGACDRPKEPEPSKPAAPAAAPSPAAPAATPASAAAPPTTGMKWADPPRWQRQAATNPMRKASYKVPKAGSDPE